MKAGQAADRGLHFGDGLFETLLVHRRRIVLRQRHWQRLLRDCQRLRLQPDVNALESAVAETLASISEEWAWLKLVVSRQASGRGYAISGGECFIQVLCGPLQSPRNDDWHQGINADIALLRCARQPLLAGMKHLNRLEQVLVSSECQQRQLDELLVFDTEGELIEGCRSNVFLKYDGQWLTPDLTNAGVSGVLRAWVMDAAAINTQIAVIDRAAVERCEALFFCNSLIGIHPVARLGQRQLELPVELKTIQEELWSEFLA